MLRDERINDGAVLAQNAGGARLVEPHEPRIADDVGGQDRRQPAFNPTWLLLRHVELPPSPSCTMDQPPGNSRSNGVRCLEGRMRVAAMGMGFVNMRFNN